LIGNHSAFSIKLFPRKTKEYREFSMFCFRFTKKNDQSITKMNMMEQNSVKLARTRMNTIRFEIINGSILWVYPEQIMFIISADHYVKSLIHSGAQIKWTIRHSTIKDILAILPTRHFIRLNRFYVLNLSQFSHFDETGKTIYLQNNISIPIDHCISPFIIGSLRN
jgi:DNA-binding LytR/AlgR family response regulator